MTFAEGAVFSPQNVGADWLALPKGTADKERSCALDKEELHGLWGEVAGWGGG